MKMNVCLKCIAIILLMTGCSNEFDFTAPAENIPVVYGFIEYTDDVHYIRVEKAFVSDTESALDLARDPDELYYDNIVVQLENTETNETYVFTRVDATEEGFPRNEGVFAETPNYLYKYESESRPFQPNDELSLSVIGPNDELLASSTTEVLDTLEIRQPNGSTISIDSRPGRNADFAMFNESDGEERIFEVELIFNYREEVPDEGFVDKEIIWNVGTVTNDGGSRDRVTLEREGVEFYSAISAELSQQPLRTRIIGSPVVRITAGGEELLEAIRLQSANTGLTSSQEIPVFTNIEGGIGVFSSRKMVMDEYNFTSSTLDSLRFGRLTRDLGFL